MVSGNRFDEHTLPPPGSWARVVLMAFIRRSLPDSKDYHPPRAMKILNRWTKLIDHTFHALKKQYEPGARRTPV
jgi:hypothetical protein